MGLGGNESCVVLSALYERRSLFSIRLMDAHAHCGPLSRSPSRPGLRLHARISGVWLEHMLYISAYHKG